MTYTDNQTANNIVIFPKKPVRDPAKLNNPHAHNQEYIDTHKRKTADSMVENYTDQIAKLLHMNGVNVFTERFVRDYTVFTEIMKATIYRSVDLDHPFHKFMDEITGKVVKAEVKDERAAKFFISRERLDQFLRDSENITRIVESWTYKDDEDDPDPDNPGAA